MDFNAKTLTIQGEEVPVEYIGCGSFSIVFRSTDKPEDVYIFCERDLTKQAISKLPPMKHLPVMEYLEEQEDDDGWDWEHAIACKRKLQVYKSRWSKSLDLTYDTKARKQYEALARITTEARRESDKSSYEYGTKARSDFLMQMFARRASSAIIKKSLRDAIQALAMEVTQTAGHIYFDLCESNCGVDDEGDLILRDIMVAKVQASV